MLIYYASAVTLPTVMLRPIVKANYFSYGFVNRCSGLEAGLTSANDSTIYFIRGYGMDI